MAVRRLVLTYLSALILALLSSRSLAEFNEADFGASLVKRFSSGNKGAAAKAVVPGGQVAQGSLGGESGVSGSPGSSSGGSQVSNSQPAPSNPTVPGSSSSSAPTPVASNSGPSHADHRSSSMTPPMPVSKPAATANLKNANASVSFNKNYPTVASNDPKSTPTSNGNTKATQTPKNSPPAHKPPSQKPPHR